MAHRQQLTVIMQMLRLYIEKKNQPTKIISTNGSLSVLIVYCSNA